MRIRADPDPKHCFKQELQKNSVCKSFLNVKTLSTLGHLRYKNRARMRKNVDSTEFCNEADLTGPKSAAHKY